MELNEVRGAVKAFDRLAAWGVLLFLLVFGALSVAIIFFVLLPLHAPPWVAGLVATAMFLPVKWVMGVVFTYWARAVVRMCPSCQTPLVSDAGRAALQTGKCPQCGHAFRGVPDKLVASTDEAAPELSDTPAFDERQLR